MANEYKSLINSSLLSYYNDKAKQRELNKINKLPFKNKSEFLKLYFAANRDEKIYGVKFAYDANDVIQASSGVKYGANANLVVEASTRTVAGRDDYRNINVFKSIDANVHYEPDGELVVDAIEGDPEFTYYGKVDVVCIFAPVYERIYDEEETVNGVTTKWWHIEWTDTPRDGFTLNILCKNPDGTNRGWYCISKFQSVFIDGIPYSSAGLYPWTSSPWTGPSYNTCVDKYHEKSPYLCGMTLSQFAMIHRIFMMKYSHTNFQSKLGSMTSYYVNNMLVQVPTTNKDFVILTKTDADKLYVNTRINIGTGTRSGNSRALLSNTEILSKDANIIVFKDINSGLTITDTNIAIVTSIPNIAVTKTTDASSDLIDVIYSQDEDISVEYTNDGVSATGSIKLVYDNTNYNLIIVDTNDNTIATSTNGDTACVAVYISDTVTVTTTNECETAIYNTGYSLEILGRDGCYEVGNFVLDYRHPSVLSGIELLTGIYEVLGNGVWNYNSDSTCKLYVCNNASSITKNTTDITNTYTNVGNFTEASAGTGWKYPKNITYDLNNGAFTMILTGGSTSNGLCDGVYYLGDQKSGFYEVLAFGHLGDSSNAGPFCLGAYRGLSSATWYLGSRVAFGVALPATS